MSAGNYGGVIRAIPAVFGRNTIYGPSIPQAIVVGSSDFNGALWSMSADDSWITTLAPGVQCLVPADPSSSVEYLVQAGTSVCRSPLDPALVAGVLQTLTAS
jgi:hypothetical protein